VHRNRFAFGFQATVTAGIISAKERDNSGEASQFQHFLQTDAPSISGNMRRTFG